MSEEFDADQIETKADVLEDEEQLEDTPQPVVRKRKREGEDGGSPKRAKVFTELSQTFKFEGGRELTVTIFFPDEDCEVGLQQRLKVIVSTNQDERPVDLRVVAVDVIGQELMLCSKPKRDHDMVMKVHNELFSRGRGEADITFYCKGVSSLCGGCGRKVPSRVQLRVECQFTDRSLQVGFSAPFLVKANRRKQRSNHRYVQVDQGETVQPPAQPQSNVSVLLLNSSAGSSVLPSISLPQGNYLPQGTLTTTTTTTTNPVSSVTPLPVRTPTVLATAIEMDTSTTPVSAGTSTTITATAVPSQSADVFYTRSVPPPSYALLPPPQLKNQQSHQQQLTPDDLNQQHYQLFMQIQQNQLRLSEGKLKVEPPTPLHESSSEFPTSYPYAGTTPPVPATIPTLSKSRASGLHTVPVLSPTTSGATIKSERKAQPPRTRSRSKNAPSQPSHTAPAAIPPATPFHPAASAPSSNPVKLLTPKTPVMTQPPSAYSFSASTPTHASYQISSSTLASDGLSLPPVLDLVNQVIHLEKHDKTAVSPTPKAVPFAFANKLTQSNMQPASISTTITAQPPSPPTSGTSLMSLLSKPPKVGTKTDGKPRPEILIKQDEDEDSQRQQKGESDPNRWPKMLFDNTSKPSTTASPPSAAHSTNTTMHPNMAMQYSYFLPMFSMMMEYMKNFPTDAQVQAAAPATPQFTGFPFPASKPSTSSGTEEKNPESPSKPDLSQPMFQPQQYMNFMQSLPYFQLMMQQMGMPQNTPPPPTSHSQEAKQQSDKSNDRSTFQFDNRYSTE